MTLPDSEVPGILVALPGLKDSYFEKTVILLFNYNEEGAMGLVMNHTSGSQGSGDFEGRYPRRKPAQHTTPVGRAGST